MFTTIKDSLIITSLVFIFMWVLSNIPIISNLEMLNPVENVLEDFDLTDVVFSQIREPQDPDTNIVLVNIGFWDRLGIAEMINRLNKHKPKVIGIDAFFRQPIDSTADSLMATALAQAQNLVMVSKGSFKQLTSEAIMNDDSFNPQSFDTLETSNPVFVEHALSGHANLITEGEENMKDFVTVRTFSPQIRINNQVETAFAVKVAEVVNPEAAQRFFGPQKRV